MGRTTRAACSWATKACSTRPGTTRVLTLLPKEKFKDFQGPAPSLPRSRGHEKEWLDACQGGPAAMSNFDYSGPLTEFVLLGNVATLFGKTIEYDPAAMKIVNLGRGERGPQKRIPPRLVALKAIIGSIDAMLQISGIPEARSGNAAVVLVMAAVSTAQLTPEQAKRIEAAVPQKARVAPKQPRRVLIWNTPFMEQSPHKGYSIPQSEYAMRMLGEKTGAFEPVVSDDVAMYLPENLKKFDAIILNNSNGPWIRPTPKDMDKFKATAPTSTPSRSCCARACWTTSPTAAGSLPFTTPSAATITGPSSWTCSGRATGAIRGTRRSASSSTSPNHPLVAAFGGKDFRLAEEIFQYNEPYSREKVRVLLSLDVEKTNMTVPWVYRKDNDFALAWIKSTARAGSSTVPSAIARRSGGIRRS